MNTIPDLNRCDPFEHGLQEYAKRLRDKDITILQCVEYCLDRIERFDGQLNAFQALDADAAKRSAAALDELLSAGTDLGPLMGVPIGVKDIMAASGFDTTNGSLHQTDLPGTEDGPVVSALRRAGCIIMGKTKTVEFALGATGLNSARGTPWNPWDLKTHRIPGGSSSGSAVAVAAGFVGFALGTDTGGSVRIPACYNGLFGHKTTVGLWSTDRVFPLSPTFDSIGPLCRSAADAAIVHSIICNTTPPVAGSSNLQGLRLGRPTDVFLDNLDDDVTACFTASIEALTKAGATIVDCESPEAHEKATLFPAIVPAELMQTLTPAGFKAAHNSMDPVTRERAEVGLSVSAMDYFAAQKRVQELVAVAETRLQGLDAWISPTCPFVPLAIETFSDTEQHQRSLLSSQNTQPGNLMRMCASTLPIQHLGGSGTSGLPVGLQLMMTGGNDEKLLSLSQALQSVLGLGSQPTLG